MQVMCTACLAEHGATQQLCLYCPCHELQAGEEDEERELLPGNPADYGNAT